ncbi:phosphoribosylaminoimidazolesuccinocarboxamide synthase [Nitrospirales bacterium NOB]|nr:MAG: phosphoribosylaminoimidazole-succinocarboxamide synthase [Nitrospira sp. OLB3]MBV6469678.1 Phosphoribosylaminoimidazole-succinocarboxamide synthase [Nitrospirota bacterium]MCE7965480.1 phosphoribosylaminoimidazolesuccinocarboxamide synthase [Nitrospira sp. NTP2]MCK6493492.1 phosphoribosylaminoimidazolesuccinocarboxamide synthase [Nitrospira sp.]MDL1889231.1 phosphoribosylaminoimidazolesuccinocarboxamide synthase [Nitrospirales bacterium NOB]
MAGESKGTMIYEGKAKKIFATDRPDQVLHYFKDDATAFNAQKRGTIADKGVVNNKVSERLFRLLEDRGIETHFLERVSDREMLTKKVTIVPVEVVVRNVVAGSLAKRLGLKEGAAIIPPIIEFYYKDDALGDPLVNDDHLRLLNVATPAVLREMRELGRKVNEVLQPFFKERRMVLVDFKLEFGVFHNRLILADEISPDTCRFWDQATQESMDKDRFRKDLGKVEEAYQEVLKRVCE